MHDSDVQDPQLAFDASHRMCLTYSGIEGPHVTGSNLSNRLENVYDNEMYDRCLFSVVVCYLVFVFGRFSTKHASGRLPNHGHVFLIFN